MPDTVNIHDAKTHLSRLLDCVRQGETIVIAKAGEPVAELGSLRRVDVVFGEMKGEITYDDEEFDAANAEVLEMFTSDLLLDQDSDPPA